jgi:hypothetical protein
MDIGDHAGTSNRNIKTKVVIRGQEVEPYNIPMSIREAPHQIRRASSRIYYPAPSYHSPPQSRYFFHRMGNPVMKLNDIPRTRTPGDVGHNWHGGSRALTRYCGPGSRRGGAITTKHHRSLIAPRVLLSMDSPPQSKPQHPVVSNHHIAIRRQPNKSSTHVRRERASKHRGQYPI